MVGATTIVVLGLLALALNSSSDRRRFPDIASTTAPSAAEAEEVDANLASAIDALGHLDEYTPRLIHGQILLNLNQWIEKQRPDPDWIADPLFSRLPSRFDGMKGDDVLSGMRFQAFDVLTLREAVWMRDIARGVIKRDRPLLGYEPWFRQLASSVGRDGALRLRSVVQLFDWTVRHIQTDPDRVVDGSDQIVPVTGGKYYAWEAAVLGHGDWLEKSRVFILLARQQNIPVVYLGIEDDEQAEPRPWCLAASIGDELYLFDMRLGLPIPRADGEGVVTLREVMDDPDILRQLDLDTDHPYPIRRRHLQRLSVLFDATPAALSQRMAVMESKLVGDQYLALTVEPTQLWQTIGQHRGLARASLLTAPYEVYRLRQRLMTEQAEDAEPLPLLTEMGEEYRPFDDLTPLLQGVMLVFRGQYEEGVDEPGAKFFLSQARRPDRMIDNLEVSEQAQKEIGIYQGLYVRQLDADTGLPAIDAETGDPVLVRSPSFDFIISAARKLLIQVKQHASYLLGIIDVDERRFEPAEAWLQRRVKDAYPGSRWDSGATYNLARLYEEWGEETNDPSKFERAVTLFESLADTPDYHGSALRARRLRGRIESMRRSTEP